MKAKVKSTGEIIEVEKIEGAKNLYGRTDGVVALYKRHLLDFSVKPKQNGKRNS